MFRVRAITIAPGSERPYEAAEWCDAIVSVERGELELERVGGGRCQFGRGSLIWLCDLPVRALRSSGRESLLLLAVSRSDDFASAGVSLRLDTPTSRKEARAMEGKFVWFDLRTKDVGRAGDFYEKLLGWNVQDQEGHSMIAGDGGPWAAIAPHTSKEAKDGAWVPYVQVDDVDAATARATELGATVLQEAMDGPAGRYSTIRDTGGAPIALWQPAA